MSVILLACTLSACSSKERESEPLTRSVYICRPTPAAGLSLLTVPGVVKENENVSLGFKTAGQIKRILVKEGDRVAAGQLLAELDAEDYKLGVEAIQIQYDQIKQEVDRIRRLYENKSMSQNDYDKAVAGLRQLDVQLQANKNKLAYTRLYAPTSGIVESVGYSPAEMVDAGTPVISLMKAGAMEVNCDIPASIYGERNRFSRYSCRSSYLGDAPIGLRLISIIPKANSSQLYRMILAFDDNQAINATAGMNVEVTIEMADNGETALQIPLSALFTSEDKDCVWVMNPDSTVSKRPVVIDGRPHGQMVNVTEGLDNADNIIRTGVSQLTQGEKVRVIELPSKTNVGGLL